MSEFCALDTRITKYSDDETTFRSGADAESTAEDKLDSDSGTEAHGYRSHTARGAVTEAHRHRRGRLVRLRAEVKAFWRKPLKHRVYTASLTPVENTATASETTSQPQTYRKVPKGFRLHPNPNHSDRVICLECGSETGFGTAARHLRTHRFNDVLICEDCSHRRKCKGGRMYRFNQHFDTATHSKATSNRPMGERRYIRIRTVTEAKD